MDDAKEPLPANKPNTDVTAQDHPIGGLRVSFMWANAYEAWQKALNPGWERFGEIWALREMHIKRCGFPIIPSELFDTLAQLLSGKRVADVGCGTGYMTYHLRLRDVNITGFDNRIDDNHYFPNLATQYLTTVKGCVVKSDYLDIDLDAYDMFIISWPDYASPDAAEFIRRLPSGKYIIYQGEDYGGCCADDRFFEILEEDFMEVDALTRALRTYSVQFPGLHDEWTVYQKHRQTLESE